MPSAVYSLLLPAEPGSTVAPPVPNRVSGAPLLVNAQTMADAVPPLT